MECWQHWSEVNIKCVYKARSLRHLNVLKIIMRSIMNYARYHELCIGILDISLCIIMKLTCPLNPRHAVYRDDCVRLCAFHLGWGGVSHILPELHPPHPPHPSGWVGVRVTQMFSAESTRPCADDIIERVTEKGWRQKQCWRADICAKQQL